MRIIEVIVSPTGEAKVQTKGFAGSKCQEASRFLEAALGEKLQERLTEEFFYQSTSMQQSVQGGGA
jgi:hypothetical protein